MKKISKLLVVILFPVMYFSSCESLLEVDSDRLVFEKNHGMDAANDTLYSMFGVFSQLQKLADSYVVLGELRGDLVDVSETSNRFLKEVNTFDFSTENPYSSNIRDYYAVINNCNYIIQNIDTSVVNKAEKVMYKVYAASKAIRAWTYMQMMLNFGEVTYYEKPLLTLEDAFENHTVYKSMNELAPVLIRDLLPWKDTPRPQFGNLSAYNSRNSFFPVRFLLGDLYLWNGQYENAANEYRDLMFYDRVLITNQFRSNYQVVNNAFSGGAIVNWVNIFNFSSTEHLTKLVASNEYGLHFTLDSLMLKRQLIPSKISVNNWQTQVYVENVRLDTIGDLRRIGSVTRQFLPSSPQAEYYVINKYTEMNSDDYDTRQIILYRAATLYLRYAEAVNRLGKPRLAFAVLKNGLKAATINSPFIVPLSEKDSILPNYMNFADARFENNIGVRGRSLGYPERDTTYFVIPRSITSQDEMMNFVEDKIIEEAALELAFEGNRFHDLMRVAVRRNDNSYLADRVAAKHTNNKEAIRSKLLDRKNWYLKK
jgi:tetratricopeptide (TPR) repeat protein